MSLMTLVYLSGENKFSKDFMMNSDWKQCKKTLLSRENKVRYLMSSPSILWSKENVFEN